MASSQMLFAVQTPYPVVTSNYLPGLRLEFARFYGETGHFKLNFSIENSNFSQFFLSGIHIHTFSHNLVKKNFSFHRHFKSSSALNEKSLSISLNYTVLIK